MAIRNSRFVIRNRFLHNLSLFDLPARWEELYRKGKEPPPEWPGFVDPALGDDLRHRIERRKRLHVLLKLPETPA